tara:strand:- start:280 stop:606 length:327 start_codon:yes stop_codon:yes gene_type:complete
MIIRQALFEGNIHPGKADEFRAYVKNSLLPLWRRFPGVREVRVMFEVEHDDGFSPVAMVLAMAFDDRTALANALASDVRYESREITKGALAMFDGVVRHHVFNMFEPV